MRWVSRTMRDIRRGDRIRLNGAEAVVESAFNPTWHALITLKTNRDGSPSSYWDTKKFEHERTYCRLEGRDKLYDFDPSMAVDIHLTVPEIEMHEALGWENRVALVHSA